MISLRLAAPAVLIAAAIAGCITYFATPGSPQRTEADQRMPPAEPKSRFGGYDEYWASKYGRQHNCLPASRRGYPEGITECEGVRRCTTGHRAYSVAQETPDPASMTQAAPRATEGYFHDRKASRA